MIGGHDKLFKTHISPAMTLDTCARAIWTHWPQAVFQDAATGRRYEAYSRIPFAQISELFVYQDENSFISWEALGADPSNCNMMVHLLCADHDLTVVVDDPNAHEMAALLSSLEKSLRDKSFCLRHLEKAA